MQAVGRGTVALFVLSVAAIIITMGIFMSTPRNSDNPVERKLAGCVPVRLIDSKLCLINSRSNPAKLVFPKGGVDAGEDAKEAAIRETWEEAGLKGEIKERIGIIDGCEWFLMDVNGEEGVWPEMSQRRRVWASAKEALKREDLKGTTRRVLMRMIG